MDSADQPALPAEPNGHWRDYTASVWATANGLDASAPATADARCAGTQPPIPVTGVAVECPAPHSTVSVSWDAFTEGTVVRYEAEEDGGDLTGYSGSATSFTRTSPIGDVYRWRVKAVLEGGDESDWSEWAGADCPPAAPSGMTVTCSADGGTLTVSWDADGRANRYEAEEEGGDLTAFAGTATSFTRVSAPGETYSWRVKSIGNGGTESDWTGWATVGCPFTAPTGLSVVCSADGLTLTVSWDADGRAASYEAQEDGGDLLPYSGTANTFTRTSAPGDSYRWQVRSIHSSGTESDWTGWVIGDCAVVPPTPANVAMACVGPPTGEQTLTVTWDQPPGNPQYDIWYNYGNPANWDTDPDNDETASVSNRGQTPAERTRSNAISVTLPAPTGQEGRLYTIRVQAESTAGTSGWSQNSGPHDPFAWVRCPGIPPALDEDTIEARCQYNANEVEVTWGEIGDKASGDTYTYQVQSNEGDSFTNSPPEWTAPGSGTSSVLAVTDWSIPSGNGIQVRAVNTHGNGPWTPTAGIDENCRLIGK